MPRTSMASRLRACLWSWEGALVGLMLGGRLEPGLIAMIAGLCGAIAAGIIRNTLLIKAWGAVGVEDAGTPAAVMVNAVLAFGCWQLVEEFIEIEVSVQSVLTSTQPLRPVTSTSRSQSSQSSTDLSRNVAFLLKLIDSVLDVLC
jgi:hypothetical protein